MNLSKTKNGKALPRRRKNSLEWQSTWQLSLIAAPGILWFLMFAYIPMFGLILAFKDFNYAQGILGSRWIGLDNFRFVFESNDAVRIFRNTVLYNAAFIVLDNILGIACALALDSMSKKRHVKFYQTCLFLPYFISWVVVGYIMQALCSHEFGLLNTLLKSLGLNGVQWYNETKPWPAIIIFAHLWKNVGFKTLVYYGSVIGIDNQLFEAAKIDGATRWQTIYKIILPLLKPTVIVMFILAIGNMMRADFGLFYYVPNNTGILYEVTDVLDTYIYRTLKQLGDICGSSAVSAFQAIVGLVLVLLSNWAIRVIDEENAMF